MRTPAKPLQEEEVVLGKFALEVRANMMQKANEDNAVALAKELAYEGVLTVAGLEDEIRFYQQRSVESVLEMGRRLLLLKEVAGHGNFQPRLEALGIDRTVAKRIMASTLKFSKGASTHLLALPNLSQTKLFELLVLDDGEVEALSSGETVRGLKLEDVDCMSVSELRKTLREANERIKAKDQVAAANQQTIQKLSENLLLARGKKPDRTAPEFAANNALHDLDEQVREIVNLIAAALRSQLNKVSAPDLEIGEILRSQAISGAVGRVLAVTRQVALDYGVLVSGPDSADGCGEMDEMWKVILADDADPAASEGAGDVSPE